MERERERGRGRERVKEWILKERKKYGKMKHKKYTKKERE